MNKLITFCLIISKYILPKKGDCCFGENPRLLLSQDWQLDVIEIENTNEKLEYALSTIPDALKIRFMITLDIDTSGEFKTLKSKVKKLYKVVIKKIHLKCSYQKCA